MCVKCKMASGKCAITGRSKIPDRPHFALFNLMHIIDCYGMSGVKRNF